MSATDSTPHTLTSDFLASHLDGMRDLHRLYRDADQQTGLSQYSCDRCKQRKLRCSRALPSCDNCKSWNGECVYSRHGKIRRRPRSNIARNTGAAKSQPQAGSQIPQPISFNPNSSAFQASSRDNPKTTQYGTGSSDDDLESKSRSGRILEDDTGQAFYVGPSPIATFLSQANSNIGKVMNDVRDSGLHQNAEESLADLSSTFAAVSFQDASEVRKNVRKLKRSSEVFFIPEKDDGEYLINLFDETMSKGSPFFRKPPKDLLSKIVFEPSAVKERGWLLLYNVVMSTDLALMTPPNLRLSKCLQWNTWMLIEDSSIFLEPSEINIQALVILAAHGQEITTPSLCWTLMTHACQMAQTLALHLPIPRLPQKHKDNQYRNCLFWGLFIVDKALALSVGRPPLLPTYLYRNARPPDPATLSLYRPHRHILGAVESPEDSILYDYGGFHIAQSLELAKFQGQVSDLMYNDRETNAAKTLELKRELDQWMERILTSTYHQIQNCKSPQEEEVKLGINIQKFQYHHLVAYLTRGDKDSGDTCLEAARAAIGLLEYLVSSSRQVFNGIIWQLLYQPFTPYFVLFSNIVSNPTSSTCYKDIQYLRQVVLYFLQMNNNHPSAGRLEKVAETFTRLAETYVRHVRRRNDEIIPPPNLSLFPKAVYENAVSTHTSETSTPESLLRTPEYNNIPSIDFSSLPALPPLDLNSTTNYNFDDMPSDPMALLNFFSPSYEMGMPLSDIADEQQDTTMGDQDILFRELKSFQQNGALDGTFDWFSWDLYDSSVP